jgi:RND family efflux transporter MFP subunit
LVLAIAASVVLLVLTRPASKPELKVLAPPRVEVVPVQIRDIQPYDPVTGRLRPRRAAALHFEVQGNLAQRLVEPGQRVARGELLLQLENDDYQDAVTDASARLIEEEAAVRRDGSLLQLASENLVLAEREFERMERLGRDSLASGSRRDETRQRMLQSSSEQARLAYSVETGEARLTMRKSRLQRALRDLERTRLKAPFDGTVNQVQVYLGDRVDATRVVLELIQDDELDLYMEVMGSTAAALRLGQQVEVVAGERQLRGTVVALQLDPDPRTYTHPVKVRIPGEGLLPGMLATARLWLRSQPGVRVIPLSALLRENGRDYVFVVNGERLERRAVELGIRHGSVQVILAGLDAEESVVARDVAALSDAQRVTLEPENGS